MNKAMALGIACMSFFLLQGCSSLTVLRTREIVAVQDSIKIELAAMEKRLADQQQQQNEMLRLIRADQEIRFAELERNVQDLGSNLSENQYRLSKIAENTADVQKQLETKLSADSVATAGHAQEVEKLFQIASGDFNAGRFDIARSGFQDIAARFPDAPQGRDAQFWIGECRYAKKEYGDAASAFLLYIRDVPQGAKSCAALYKLGLCYGKTDKKKSRDLVWKKLLEQCPGTNEADLVTSALQEEDKGRGDR